jgi:N-glycosylase/DNA lyase
MSHELKEKYEIRKNEIKNRMLDFKKVFDEDDERVFAELAFCLCTPQSKAIHCWKAVETLMKNRLLYTGDESQIKPFMNAVRFNENKSRYIVGARKLFSPNGKLEIKNKLQSFNNVYELREWLYENVNGLGMKEVGHFLRNIGLGNQLAILDVHILKNLHKHGVIQEIPKSLTKKKYLEIEQSMKKFAQDIDIPFEELDLLLWSEETGIVFK